MIHAILASPGGRSPRQQAGFAELLKYLFFQTTRNGCPAVLVEAVLNAGQQVNVVETARNAVKPAKNVGEISKTPGNNRSTDLGALAV